MRNSPMPETKSLTNQQRVDRLVNRWIQDFEWRATEHSPDSRKPYPMLRQMIVELIEAVERGHT